jgi:hypothetical protein
MFGRRSVSRDQQFQLKDQVTYMAEGAADVEEAAELRGWWSQPKKAGQATTTLATAHNQNQRGSLRSEKSDCREMFLAYLYYPERPSLQVTMH